ncbi:putative polyketide synthase [Ilyonectria robusta]|uniref:putative polyketide synthase n=1 Tax=Ilyonectria robusta TaxID=1079257 RepID=UPI001E8CBB0E|nr:putative polyketide synthase [Ilyonectria robusta]KAH8729278.1 putative polyketide synthase [Ilyonectria robusta]
MDSSYTTAGAAAPAQNGTNTTSHTGQEPIAIVSVACRLPGHCMNPQQLWEFLINGGVATSNSPPESRFNIKGHFDGSRKTHTMISPGGMFIEDIDLQAFDAQFFNVNRADAIAMEPQQRQILEVVYECLENGGVPLESLTGKEVGCFVASYAVDFGDIQARDPEDRAGGISMGIGRSILSNRISHFLNIKGPSMTIDTACSGGLVSLDVACKYLQAGLMDGALVASANINMDPEHTIESGSLRGTISESGKCHTFDNKADGYVKSEAVNCVYIKRLRDAIRDGDPIRAVIRGTSSNSDGRTPGIASPSSEAQAAAAMAAYERAGITDLSRTGYLECHGTGTPAGDPIETTGASMVFKASHPADDPLIVGSIKSNIGHSENAAGISSLLKATLAVESGIIPGNPTFITPNPKIDFAKLHLRPSRVAVNWPKSKNDYRRASVNSFGFGGTNAHAIVEASEHYLREQKIQQHVQYLSTYSEESDDFFDDDDDEVDESAGGVPRPQVVVFSANNLDSLKLYLKKLRTHLLNPRVSIKLSDLTYTLSERRTRLYHRGFAVITKGPDAKVDGISADSVIFGKQAADPPKIGFVFTGQGAQWPQMGRDLLTAFPETAGAIIKRLDVALQDLSPEVRPAWSIYSELTESRTSDHMRLPEFSQPLVTALQLALFEVLKMWGVSPRAVVGHSSGEIAAACTAGLLTPEQAIKIAYLRGYAGKAATGTSEALSMMAVGMGPEKAQPYLDAVNVSGEKPVVEIACYNSPSSITLAGTVDSLNVVREAIQADGHFARLLQVNLAYHSRYMGTISEAYEKLLVENKCLEGSPKSSGSVKMFSSVLREKLSREAETGVDYWKANMVSPVRFADACLELMKDQEDGADFLIELGPSNALAGPVGQIKKTLPNDGTNIMYASATKRGAETLQALYSVAGQLFIAGADIPLTKVNGVEGVSPTKPSILIDLPNYAWNHTTKYWHESEISKEWRFRRFLHHDLLGSKVLGTSWNAPSWKKPLKLSDFPWLSEHKMGTDVVFPGAGYIAMAIEAVHQTTLSLATDDEAKELDAESYHYQLRDVKFSKALVLDDTVDAAVMLNLTPTQGLKSRWYKYEVISTVGGEALTTTSHSTGFVRLNKGLFKNPPADPESLMLPLKHTAPAKLWYGSMADAGYGFGPSFQKQVEVEVTLGQPKSRSLVNLTSPSSKWKQSYYPLHPVVMDGCFQTVSPSLWHGDRSAVDSLLIPASVDSLCISAFPEGQLPEVGLSISSAKYLGRGRLEDKIHYSSYASVYNPTTGDAIFDMKGLRYHRLETQNASSEPYPYTRLEWKPDFSYLREAGKLSTAIEARKIKQSSSVHSVIDFAAHKKPHLAVLEVNLTPNDTSSLWLEKPGSKHATRAACRAYQLISKYPDAVLEAENQYAGSANAKFTLLDPTSVDFEPSPEVYDLVIVKLPPTPSAKVDILIANIDKHVAESGSMLFIQGSENFETQLNGEVNGDAKELTNGEVETTTAHVNGETNGETNGNHVEETTVDISVSLEKSGFKSIRTIPSEGKDVAVVASKSALEDAQRGAIALVRLSETSEITSLAAKSLSELGWSLTEHASSVEAVQHKSTVLVIDELAQPLLTTVTDSQWSTVKELVRKECNILWVTQGAQMAVKNPQASVAQGVFRSVRSEEPLLNIITLDVESSEAEGLPNTVAAVDTLLQLAQNKPNQESNDFEFVERGGILYIPRILPDEGLHSAQVEGDRASTRTVDLHASKSTIRLITGKRGDIDSLHWTEIGSSEATELEPGFLEVEIYASSLNFKDVIVAMGIIPENEHLLGLDGAGIVTRVGPGVTDRHVGQRVAVLERGTLANRVITPREYTMTIPDSMSFEEGATMPLVFVTSMESLFGLANLRRGQKVLIHSAAGGIGISSIQLCKYKECEVFATVGSEDKRQFLKDSFGIPDDHIFSSRSTKFAKQILDATNGYGVDVILNSLTGELLEESWRIIATAGTMVEIGKHDILERRSLPMEPFGRNASFRALDLSLKEFPKRVVGEHLDLLSELVQQGHMKPINPIKVFSFEEIGDAFRFLGSGKHIGKLIISNGEKEAAQVTVQPPKRSLEKALNPEHSYLVVGGLKGLCGSLAIWLAKNGAKHLAIMSRSGSADEKSLGVIKDIEAQGCAVELLKGDVADTEDVRRCLKSTVVPIGGIVQGAMVLRDRMFDSMTHQEYHEALACKVQGTWNLHTVSQELNLPLSFFTMLSSISGIIGQKGQTNYSGGNTFLDSLAVYRRDTLGLPATTVNLGIIEGIGYLADHDDVHKQLTRNLDTWAPINEAKLRRIFEFSVFQQDLDVTRQPSPASVTQMITGMQIPLPGDTELFRDARFTGLHITTGKEGDGAKSGDRDDKELQTFLLLIKTKGTDPNALLTAAVELANAKFTKLLRLAEPMEPSRPMSIYGLDSLVAVEFRNWARTTLSVELSTLEITNAQSLIALCEKIVAKAAAALAA